MRWSDLLVVVAANALGAVMSFPQAWRLWRHRRVEGVSAVWAGASVATNLWWIAYAVGLGRWAVLPVAVASVAGYAAVLAALARFGAVGVSTWGGAAALVGLVPLLGLLAGGWVVAGVVLGLLYGVQLAPAVAATWRSVDLTGISLGTWTLAAVEAVLWGWYGLRHADAGVFALGVTGTAMAALVLLRVFHWQRVTRPSLELAPAAR